MVKGTTFVAALKFQFLHLALDNVRNDLKVEDEAVFVLAYIEPVHYFMQLLLNIIRDVALGERSHLKTSLRALCVCQAQLLRIFIKDAVIKDLFLLLVLEQMNGIESLT